MDGKKKSVAVLSGAGMSAESGLKTFRDANGLWENHRVEDVATPEAWRRNPALVLRFYNERRRALADARPNAGHLALAELEREFAVRIITQNVDDLHERAGSTSVLHLHGELTKARSSVDESAVYEIGYGDISLGDRCPRGGQLRPHIVWFGEAVPAMNEATAIVSAAEALLIVGTSLQVYPAAGLVNFVSALCPIVLVDPNPPAIVSKITVIRDTAANGIPKAIALVRGKLCH